MGEFDLDPRVEGAAGFGWQAHFGNAAPADAIRMADCSDGCVYACGWVTNSCNGTCHSCQPATGGCSHTCGATGQPCLC